MSQKARRSRPPSAALQPTGWHQHLIEFTDPDRAEQLAAHDIAPAMNEAQDTGLLRGWWYIRKAPAWRLRYLPTNQGTTVVSDLLARLADDGRIAAWAYAVYEPETVAFGGPAAMDAAHELFCNDSRHLLGRFAQPGAGPRLGRREATVMLCTAMLRSAGLDWFEQGDVWAKVAHLRPTAHHLTPGRSHELASATRTLLAVDPRTGAGPLPEHWLAAFEDAGKALAALVRGGQLGRGLRAVLAHHVIFHANRAGLPATDQGTLAALAVDTIFHAPEPARPPTPHRGTAT